MDNYYLKLGDFALREDARVLGEGNASTVFEGVHCPSGQPVAVKVIDKSSFTAKDLAVLRHQAELVGKRAGYHSNIVTIHAIHESEEELYFVVELMREDLFSFISRDDNKQNYSSLCSGLLLEKNLFRQLAEAIAHCHYRGVAHHDLKLENCLLDDKLRLKVTDFCACEVSPPHVGLHYGGGHFEPSSKYTDCRFGTDAYFPPEVLEGALHDAKAVDIWAMGVILYALVKKTFPFHPEDLDTLYEQNSSADFIDELLAAQIEDDELRDLLAAMLRPNPGDRCEITEVLQHPWLVMPAGPSAAASAGYDGGAPSSPKGYRYVWGSAGAASSSSLALSAPPPSPPRSTRAAAVPPAACPACTYSASPPPAMWIASDYRRD